MKWQYKKEYQGQKIGIKGFGLLDTNLESADTIHKLSLMSEFRGLIRYIERAEQKPKKAKKSEKANKLSDK